MVMTDNGSPHFLGSSVAGSQVTGGLGRLTETGLEVPLVVSWPGQIRQGRVSEALVDCTDVFPTLLELAGAESPDQMVIDGRSFADELDMSGTSTPSRRWSYSQ